jgi:3-oxoadipate enol-lactonase
MPTYAKDYFVRRPELAFLYDDLRILGARPPEDAIARIGRLRHSLALVQQKLTMPALCIIGEEDALMPLPLIRELAQSLPDCRLITIPHCGHSTYFECPDVFNQAVLQFARSIGFGG